MTINFHDKEEVVFLTRGELHIHSTSSLSIHLKPDDPRVGVIKRLNKNKKLKLVTINPKIDSSSVYGFHNGNWYLIPTLIYTGCSNHSKYSHFSFSYRMISDFSKSENGIRKLTSEEISNVKIKSCLG